MRETWRAFGGAVAVAMATIVVSPVPPAAGQAETTAITVSASADTYVSSATPGKSYGSATHMTVDNSPVKHAFVRFNVAGIDGRVVRNVRLRLHQVDSTRSGGRVHRITDTTWPEAITWNTRPAVDGPLLGEFGAVASGAWYELSLGPIVAADGPVAFAMDTLSSDGSRWSTRESGSAPQLVVELDEPPPPPPPPTEDGLSTVADPTVGSSDPTFYAMQHRVARTAGGRTIVVHGRHASGVQLAWRDPGGQWSTVTQGAVLDGQLLSGTRTGDWPASIAIGRGADGNEHAWVVWGGTAGFGETPRPIEIRHLSALDAAGGPMVGAVTRVVEPGLAGNGRADIAMERLPSGAVRGWLFWAHRTSDADTAAEHYVASFDGIESDTPRVNQPTLLFAHVNRSLGTFVDTPGTTGLALVTRTTASKLAVYRHDVTAAVGGWTASTSGVAITTQSRPAAAALPNGDALVAVESDTNQRVVTVQRFTAAGGAVAPELTMTGYTEPTVAAMADGTAIIVAIRTADGVLVSRTRLAGAPAWTSEDRVELGPEGGGNYQFPNALRQSDNTLRLVVRGPAGGTYQTSVLSLVRTL